MDERAKNGGGLVISEDVIVKIASMAATDVKALEVVRSGKYPGLYSQNSNAKGR